MKRARAAANRRGKVKGINDPAPERPRSGTGSSLPLATPPRPEQADFDPEDAEEDAWGRWRPQPREHEQVEDDEDDNW